MVSSSEILSKGSASNSILEFCILKAFMESTHATSARKITLVNWYLPKYYFIRCNVRILVCQLIIRDLSKVVLFIFIGTASVFHAEITAIMKAIE